MKNLKFLLIAIFIYCSLASAFAYQIVTNTTFIKWAKSSDGYPYAVTVTMYRVTCANGSWYEWQTLNEARAGAASYCQSVGSSLVGPATPTTTTTTTTFRPSVGETLPLNQAPMIPSGNFMPADSTRFGTSTY